MTHAICCLHVRRARSRECLLKFAARHFLAGRELESVDACAQNGRELTQDFMGWLIAA